MDDRQPIERAAEGIWTNLRRRKVVQWGLVYVAAAWGFLQGLEYVSEAFHWPEQLRQIALLVLLIGLPIVLVLAWYHGDRGQQRVSTPEFAILTLLILLGGGAFWYYQRTSDVGTDSATTASTAQLDKVPGTKDARPSVAVLPFENRSREADDAFFVDGIHDDILNQLSKVSALRVISRTSVERFRKTELSVQQIAEQLGVRSILEGGVQRAGDRVRINVQLIDADTDAHQWAESYDRELTVANMFAIQSEVAAAIAAALKIALPPAEQARAKAVPTQNLRAWEAYQLGKQRMAKRTGADLADAEQFFREAIDIDPNFALAYLGLADSLTLQIDHSALPAQAALSDAEKAVAAALELDRNLAEAWASSGLIARFKGQDNRAESMFRRAIKLNPNYASARHWYGVLLNEVGRLDEALAQLQRAVELDPLSTVIREGLGYTLEKQGRFPEAEAAFRRAITIDPSRPNPYMDLAFLNAYVRDHFAAAVPLAQKAMELNTGSLGPYIGLALLYFDLGKDTEFVRWTAQATKRWPGDQTTLQYMSALVDLLRMDAAGAVRHAQRAYDQFPRFRETLALLRNADLQNGRYDAALARYEAAYPELFVQGALRFDGLNYGAATDIALVAQKRGDGEQSTALLDGAATVIRTMPRLGLGGYGIADVQIHALRGDKAKALAALRAAERARWRGPYWRYYRDFDLNIVSIRNEPEFKAVFADIERDMAAQRGRLAARPKDAPLELTDASR